MGEAFLQTGSLGAQRQPDGGIARGRIHLAGLGQHTAPQLEGSLGGRQRLVGLRAEVQPLDDKVGELALPFTALAGKQQLHLLGL